MFEQSFLSVRVGERDAVVRRCVGAALLCQTTIALSVWLLPLLRLPELETRPSAPPMLLPPVRTPPPQEPVRPIRAVSPERIQLAAPATPQVSGSLRRAIRDEAMAPMPSLEPLWASTVTAPPSSALSASPGRAAVRVASGSDAGSVTNRSRARVSSGVSAGLLLRPIRPIYPQIAIAAHVEGTVLVEAVISREGDVLRVRVASGPPMLAQAALEAVRTAHYRPFRLNGEPTEVETSFSVVFRLGGR